VLTGPTGTGKTYLVETLAAACATATIEPDEYTRSPLLRVNCAEYALDHEVARLVGAPPGYLGHRETKPVLGTEPLMTRASRSLLGFPIILFDEIEKAAKSMERILLGILEGHLELGDGSAAPLRGALFVFTSNAGSRDIYRASPGLAGRTVADLSPRDLERRYRREFEKAWSPELLNRVDEIIPFYPLSQDERAAVARRILDRALSQIVVGLTRPEYDVGSDVIAHVVARSDAAYGARDVRRVVTREIVDPLLARLHARHDPPARIRVRMDGEDVIFEME
jgi:ATP-dependent Clp protease ATP-binding subunit ClpA